MSSFNLTPICRIWKYGIVIILSYAIMLGGCVRKSPGGEKISFRNSVSEIRKAFSKEKIIHIGKEFYRLPAEKIVDGDSSVIGYIQEEIYRVQGDSNSMDARLFIVFDSLWHRRGFITDGNLAYLYDLKGNAVPVFESDFYAAVKVILKYHSLTTIIFEPYDVGEG